jgi:ribose transport system permease protein
MNQTAAELDNAHAVDAPATWAKVQELALRFVMVWTLIALSILAQILYPGFFEWTNILNILSQNAPVGLVAVGMTVVIIAGGFDLSVAAILAAAGVVFASLSNDMPIGIAAILTIVLGAIAGLINGVIVTRLKVNAFIATLGTSSLYAGATALYTSNYPKLSANSNFGFLGSEKWFGIPVSIYLLACVLGIGALVLAKTVYGRSVYAVGGNREAARLAGMSVEKTIASTFVISGVCAALAGMVVASLTGVGQPEIETGITLNAIAIVIIGGTSLFGGEGAMWRTLVGLLIFGVINNLFDSLAWPTATQQVVLGAVVLTAMTIDGYLRSRSRA